jgi:hypothetical protein
MSPKSVMVCHCARTSPSRRTVIRACRAQQPVRRATRIVAVAGPVTARAGRAVISIKPA